MKKSYKVIVFILFFVLFLYSQDKGEKKYISPDELIKQIEKEKKALSEWELRLKQKEMALKEWENELKKLSKKLVEERKKLAQEWKKLEEERKAKTVDKKIIKLYETMEPQTSAKLLLTIYKKDPKFFLAIVSGMKADTRAVIIEEIAKKEPDTVVEITNLMAKIKKKAKKEAKK